MYKLIPILLLISIAAHAEEEVQSRGVNPADIDNRIDLIVKNVMLDGEGDVLSITGKFDKKLSQKVGLNFELPMYTKLDTPFFSASGNGDFYARARYITQKGRWSVGASTEIVLPIASKDALGFGKYQVNFGALAVRPVNAHFMVALVAKQVTSVGGDSNRSDINTTEFRVLPIFPLDNGWAVVGEYRRVFSHENANPTFSYGEVSLNKQLDTHWALSGSYSHTICDCGAGDDGGISASVKYFF